MNVSRFAISILLGAVSTGYGQPIYPGLPDWQSTDTPYSTGGALVDVDQDGWLDFVVANGNDMRREKMAVYYGQGDGTFPLSPDWQSDDLEYNGHLSIADVNGDGWLDVAVGLTWEDPGTATARLYLNNGGTFSSLPDWETPDELEGFHVAFGDVNGDGRPDLAVGTGLPYTGSHTLHNFIYMNVGGMLESSPSWTSDDTWDLMEIFFCDVDGDGFQELVGVGTRTDTWVYGNDAGTLATTAVWHTTDVPTQFSVMGTYGDVDDDGMFDLFVTDNTQLSRVGGKLHGDGPGSSGDRSGPRGTGFLRRYNGMSPGPFATTPTWSHFENYGSAVALADIDADGDLDVATGSWWGATKYFLNAGGLYGAAPDWSSSGTSVVEAIVFGDVDNNGLRWPTEAFDVSATPGRRLFKLSHQPVQAIDVVSVDGDVLAPNQFTYDLVHGWVSVGPTPVESVEVSYVISVSPDMAVTNWDDSRGNYLYYSQRAGTRAGDFDGDDFVDGDDFTAFTVCFTGADAGPPDAGCESGDADLDGDIDCADYVFFHGNWTEPGEPPWFSQCPDIGAVPAISTWSVVVLVLCVLVAATVILRRVRVGH